MSDFRELQDCFKGTGRIAGLLPRELLSKMRREGAELLGLGVANRPLLSLLPRLGVTNVVVRDRRPPDGEALSLIEAAGARIVTGDGYLEGLGTGVLFRTPSLRPDAKPLLAAADRGATVTSEVALFLALCPARLFCVTGSDGKTTTAMMTAAMLRAAGRRVFLGGNIGTPLLEALPDMTADDAAVLELSSFQLSDLPPPRGNAAITNVTENHLDWHTDMQEYAAAKARILGDGRAVLPADCPWLTPHLAREGALPFSLTPRAAGEGARLFCEGGRAMLWDGGAHALFPTAAVTLRGEHHIKNALAAAGLVLGEVTPDEMETALLGFRGAPHRCEYVGTYRGVACYDSSIDTTPSRTAATLSAFRGEVVVLLGGRDKNLDLAPLGEAVTSGAVGAVVTGECREAIAHAIRERDPAFPLAVVADFSSAVAVAHRMAAGRGTLLLSPACTSFDAFRDYRERGHTFREALENL
ncbi:MAG: UDP-N-acetylmuramoyl-L-alanine--D-glutamate ligase [Clostridia bacterium]|nr:UDP-N-acetylmuramoyl-L-alanine--D-glutamate ligase [Clostridia bacterium]